MTRILLVEDQEDNRLLVKLALEKMGAEVVLAPTAQAAMKLLHKGFEGIELAILDLMLPDGCGLSLLREMRAFSESLPILFLTAADDIDHKLEAFSLGADDYIVKPVSPRELVARVERRMKQASRKSQSDVLRRGRLRLRPALMEVKTEDGQLIELTGKEFKILYFLAQHEGKVFSRAQLVERVWGGKVHVLDRTVDSHICGIRRKLGGCSHYVESLPQLGYRFAAAEPAMAEA